jgi:hypothetical protein
MEFIGSMHGSLNFLAGTKANMAKKMRDSRQDSLATFLLEEIGDHVFVQMRLPSA